MKTFMLVTALWLAASSAQALSCRALVILGTFATREECEAARLAGLKQHPGGRCMQCQ